MSRREVSQTVKWDSCKKVAKICFQSKMRFTNMSMWGFFFVRKRREKDVLGQFPVDGCCGICFMRGDELSFPEGEQNISKGMYHLTLLLTFNGIKCCAVEQPYPELDLIGFSDFQLLGNSG
ncbi:hypothetical protein CDAR_609171 [Caerostris darwini]|uniref:Uncharacterized protein n=1 Tax=Caerostris darwini TaxID=1538125 RepID=A0AAV4U408_9ARAC|nr:hypothetical protein CDAR_609171 [Caerostris darwini]